jgi:dihydroorotase
MPRTLITGGRVICPAQGLDRVTNLLLENGRIAEFDAQPSGQEEVLEASGKIVAPGLVDIHVQLREPGCEEDETIETGGAAALAGGYTSIACMPDTEPPIDTPAAVQFVLERASRAGHCRVHVIGCISKNREGKELAEIGSLVEAGAIGFSDGACPVENPDLLRRALEYCRMWNKPVLHHPESPALARGGVMHEGSVSMVLGLPGLAAAAEDVMVSRDIRLAEATEGRLHIMNVSSHGTVEIIQRVKARGIKLTAEISPVNFSLTDEELKTFQPCYKVNPPLRSRKHVEACIQGLKEGAIDVIASCHTPRAAEKKLQELDLAPFGMASLETTLAAVVTYLIRPGHLDWPTALAKLTINPARVLDLDQGGVGTLRIGAPADVVIIDPEEKWTVEPSQLKSKGTSTPFAGRELYGKAVRVLVGGQVRL